MESCNLAHLSSDFWIDISPFLTSIELGRLSMIGCKLLFDKLTHGISSFVHLPRHQRRYSLPSLIFSFPNLLHLDITLLSSNSRYEWRTIDFFDISSLPKSLKSLNLNLDRVGNVKWLYDWISSSLSSSGMTLESLLPKLTSFTFAFDNQDWETLPISNEYLFPLLSLPLIRLSLPSFIHILPSHISTFLNHHTLLDLDITLLNGDSFSLSSFSSSTSPPSSPPSSSITFPPNLTRLHVNHLPAKFPFILLPRTLLDLHVGFTPRNDNEGVDPEQLKDWPPNLTKLSIDFGDEALTYYLYLTSAIASSLPRTLTSLDWEIKFFEDPNVLQEMPPKLTECSTSIHDEEELISESIPFLPKSLTSIQSTYLHVPSLWKYLPKTITSIEYMEGSSSYFNTDSSHFIQDLPPLLTHLHSYTSFFQPSCPMLENITQLSILLGGIKPNDWEIFFNIISTQVPHLEWLDLWGDFLDGSLLDILQQPLKRLQLTCDPRTLIFNSGKWSQSLQVLDVGALHNIQSDQMDIDAFIEQRDPNWHLPPTLTSLSSHHSLILLSPSSPQHWPPNLTQICLFNLFLNNSTILWTSLPSSLLNLEIRVNDGKIDLLSNPDFIDSLKYLPPGIISFKLYHLLYTSYDPKKLYRDWEGKFCFPKSLLDLAKTHPRLACFMICENELDLSRIDCNPSSRG
jgi:hypothetical protein